MGVNIKYSVILRESSDQYGSIPLHAAVVTPGAAWCAMSMPELLEEVIDRGFFVYVKKICSEDDDVTWEETLQTLFKHVEEDHARSRFDEVNGAPPMPIVYSISPLTTLQWLRLVGTMGLLPLAIQ